MRADKQPPPMGGCGLRVQSARRKGFLSTIQHPISNIQNVGNAVPRSAPPVVASPLRARVSGEHLCRRRKRRPSRQARQAARRQP